MLITFTCDAYENITMFGDIAVRLLKMMGQSGTVPGAILAENVPAALMQLTQAIAKEKKQAPLTPSGDNEDKSEVSLRHRALPLIQLLQSAVKQNCDVMWK